MNVELKRLHGDFLEDLEIAQGRSQKTIENYDHYLRRFYDLLNIEQINDITMDAIREFRRHLNDKSQIALITQNYHLIALRQFLKYLARRDVPALAPEKIGLAKIGEREIDVLYPEEIDALLATLKNETREDLRDKAILHTLFATGLRISELVHLDRDDIRKDVREIAVRGKGNKVRVVFLSEEAHAAIWEYVDKRTDMDPALFVRHKKGGKQDELRLSARSIQRMMKKYAVQAGLTKSITPHTLRHSFATDLLSNGADVRQVQQLLGHASITTTQIYTHLTDAHLRDVYERFHRKNKTAS
jgi:site-specific recombinase XerD